MMVLWWKNDLDQWKSHDGVMVTKVTIVICVASDSYGSWTGRTNKVGLNKDRVRLVKLVQNKTNDT